MEVLAGRVILTPSDFDLAREFYESTLGLRVFREYGSEGRVSGVVFFMGGGYLELTRDSGSPGSVADPAAGSVAGSVRLWLQVPDLAAEQRRLLAAGGVRVTQPAQRMPWGLQEMWIEGPDAMGICLVEVPPDHPMRRRL